MGGRGYHNDVTGYLNSNKRTCEYVRIPEISDDKIDYIFDKVSPKAPNAPEFSNSPSKIYALVGKDGVTIKSITVYDSNHEQAYSIHLDHDHQGNKPHVHSGMNGGRKQIEYTKEHSELVDQVLARFNGWVKV